MRYFDRSMTIAIFFDAWSRYDSSSKGPMEDMETVPEGRFTKSGHEP